VRVWRVRYGAPVHARRSQNFEFSRAKPPFDQSSSNPRVYPFINKLHSAALGID
jgi:hypothetical protein